MEKLRQITSMLKDLIKSMYTGKIIIHMNKGSICKAEKHESLKLK